MQPCDYKCIINIFLYIYKGKWCPQGGRVSEKYGLYIEGHMLYRGGKTFLNQKIPSLYRLLWPQAIITQPIKMLNSVNDLVSKYQTFQLTEELKGKRRERWGTLVLKEAGYLQEVFGNPQILLVSWATEELADAQHFTQKALTCGGAGPYGCYLRSLIPVLNPISVISYSGALLPNGTWHPDFQKQVSCMQELLTLPTVSQAPITPSHT